MCPSQTILLSSIAHSSSCSTTVYVLDVEAAIFFCLPYSPFDGSGRILSDGHKYEYATILTAYWAKVNKDEIWKSKEETFEGRERKKNTLKVAVNELNRKLRVCIVSAFTHCQMQQNGQHTWIAR